MRPKGRQLSNIRSILFTILKIPWSLKLFSSYLFLPLYKFYLPMWLSSSFKRFSRGGGLDPVPFHYFFICNSSNFKKWCQKEFSFNLWLVILFWKSFFVIHGMLKVPVKGDQLKRSKWLRSWLLASKCSQTVELAIKFGYLRTGTSVTNIYNSYRYDSRIDYIKYLH